MKKIEIVNQNEIVLFSYEIQYNTILKTIEKAIKNNTNLRGANLRGADLYGANLRGADLYGANLRGANLRGADLYGANLRGADLYGANLRGANLHGADLHGADLHGADLHRADLYEANLHRANLHGADLYGANLYGADLYGANLYGADLYGAIGIDINSLYFAQTRILPEGDIIGYKKCKDNIIVKLLIPKEAKRIHAFGRKCRAEYVKVIEIFGGHKEAFSQFDSSVRYAIGKTIRTKEPFNEDYTKECTSGIHFFITKIEAENY